MEFEWDESKNKINIEKHGIDFNDAKEVFNKPILAKEDTRFQYGERRWIAIGLLLEFVVVIVYTVRNTIIRIISVRIANKNEKQKYYDTFK
jgi:uncharacterized DUF497 family protein